MLNHITAFCLRLHLNRRRLEYIGTLLVVGLLSSAMSLGASTLTRHATRARPYAAAVTIASLSSGPSLGVQHTLRLKRTYTMLVTVNVTGHRMRNATVILDGGLSFKAMGFGRRVASFPDAWAFGPLSRGSVVPYVFVLHPETTGPATLRVAVLPNHGPKASAAGVTVWQGVIVARHHHHRHQ